MRLCSLLFLFCFSQSLLFAQSVFTVSGTLRDADNGETLIAANITDLSTLEGTISNDYGFYSITLPANQEIQLEFAYVGFQPQIIDLFLTGDTVINIELNSGLLLQEVEVKSNSFQERIRSTEMSVEVLDVKEAKVIPAVFGEVDVIKTIQLKPGISSGSEGSAGLFVRGGGLDQNLIVLDEALVYNANHLFGFFSTFNADAIKDIKVYKGGFPSQYGGRLSSVIDVKLKEGNQKRLTASGGIGLISSRLTVEGPIAKDKTSFIVSGRRTYVDLITSSINRSNDDPDADPIPDYFFYDLNAKLNHKFSDKDRLFVSGYFGRDVFSFNNEDFTFKFDWGNATGTARWNHVFNPKLFANTTFTFSDYQYNISNELTGFSFNLSSKVRDVNGKMDFYYQPNSLNTWRFGGTITYHQFEVGRLKAGSDDGEISFSAGQDLDGTEAAVYVSDEMKLGDNLRLNAGLRFSGFFNDGTSNFGVEPRLAGRYIVNERLSVKASYARMMQYVHLVSNTSISLPTDIWYPTTENVKPQISDQVAGGISLALNDQLLLTNEYYYKRLDNQIDFVDHAQLFANDDLEDEFVFGDGYAYGMELGIEKKEGRLTGWIGYTLGFIRRGNFRGLDGETLPLIGTDYYPPRYDRRHDLSVVLIYEVSKRLTATATFVYGSGDISWLPSGRFSLQDIQGSESFSFVPEYRERNQFRLPAYHRADFGLVYQLNKGDKFKNDLTLSIYNVYDRRNPYFLYIDFETEDITTPDGDVVGTAAVDIEPKQVSLFPVLPAITWNFSF